jgi:hypothetical protein
MILILGKKIFAKCKQRTREAIAEKRATESQTRTLCPTPTCKRAEGGGGVQRSSSASREEEIGEGPPGRWSAMTARVRAVRRRRGERAGSDLTAPAGEEKGRGSTAVARRPFAGREMDRRPNRLVWRLERSSGGGQEGIDHEFVLDLDAFLRLSWVRNLG